MARYFSQRLKAKQKLIRGTAQTGSSKATFYINSGSISQAPSKETISLLNLLNAYQNWCDTYIPLNQGLKTGCWAGLHSVLKISKYQLGKHEKANNIMPSFPHNWLEYSWPLPVRRDWCFPVPKVFNSPHYLISLHLLINLAVRVPVGRAECHKLGLPVVYSWQHSQLVSVQAKYFECIISLQALEFAMPAPPRLFKCVFHKQ